MKIGIESQRIFRKGKHGMDVVAMELVKQVQLIDTQNEYLLFAREGEDKGWLTPSSNLKTIFLKGFTYPGWEQLSLPAAVKKHRPDLLHCTANTAPYSCPVPMVVTVHDVIYIEETTFGGTAYQDVGNLYRKLVVPRAIRNATKIITVSEYEKRVIVDVCKTDPEKIEVIHNGVSERFHPHFTAEDLRRFRKQYNLPEKFIFFFGNTAPKKNTIGAIKAYVDYCSMANEPLPVVIGDYAPSLVEKILRKLNRADLMKHFHLPGYISSLQMPLLYNCASVFIYPSLRESFGLPVLEAMACGTPVITSDIPALREIAGEAAVFVDPDQPAQIAEKIHFLLSAGNASGFVQKGLERVKMFSWQSSAEKLIELYNKIL
ncbi:MAG: glycosyltransferase family 4 protein [Chitinophagaceae bacterium]|nr:glycosyltransferase family 4 protein [Chitinophagaceae bacterium]